MGLIPKCPKCGREMKVDGHNVRTHPSVCLSLLHNYENEKVYCEYADLNIWVPIDWAFEPIAESYISSCLKTAYDDATFKADEIDRHIMKKTTQDSPEWHGRANKKC